MHTCVHFCSPPSGVSGSAPEWEWINNTKVWLDVWDPDSGFHFPDREPGRCPFLLPSNFFQESWNNRTEHQTPNTTQNKRGRLLFPPELRGKLTPRRRCTLQVLVAQMFQSGRSNSALCHRHWTLCMCPRHETEATCFPLRGGFVSSQCIPMKPMPSSTPSTKHLDLLEHWFLTGFPGNYTFRKKMEQTSLEVTFSRTLWDFNKVWKVDAMCCKWDYNWKSLLSFSRLGHSLCTSSTQLIQNQLGEGATERTSMNFGAIYQCSHALNVLHKLEPNLVFNSVLYVQNSILLSAKSPHS